MNNLNSIRLERFVTEKRTVCCICIFYSLKTSLNCNDCKFQISTNNTKILGNWYGNLNSFARSPKIYWGLECCDFFLLNNNERRGVGQALLQLQAWVSTKWSQINSSFFSIILIFHQYSVSKIRFYHTILQDSICRYPGLELLKALGRVAWTIVWYQGDYKLKKHFSRTIVFNLL